VDRSAAAPAVSRPALRAAGATLGALLLAAGAALGGWRLLSGADLLRIREVRFAGAQRASAAELAALATVKPGDPLLGADLEALERAVARHPWVKSVEARRRLPPAVEVRVEERTPGALVDLGGLYLVDRQAHVFKRAAPGDGLDLPVVTGFTRDDYLQRRADLEPLLAGALALLEGYAREGLAAFGAVSEVHVDPDEGVTLYIGEEATQVRLGVGDLPQKLERLHRVLGTLRAGGRRAEVLHLDNRNRPSWVTVRLASAAAVGRAKGQPDEAAPERVGGVGGRSFTATPHLDVQGVKGPRGPR
jgi:cell division protein FtsQ